MDIKTLNNEFFSHCNRFYEVGKLFSQQDKLYFTSLINNNTEEVNPKDIKDKYVDKNNHKIKVNTVKAILAKKIIKQEDIPFLIISNSEMTFNNISLNEGDIVLFTNPIVIYNKLSPLFDMECKKTKRFNKEEAVNLFKFGNRSNDYTNVEMTQNDSNKLDNEFETLRETVRTISNTKTSRATINDDNTNFSGFGIDTNSGCQLVAVLFDETSSGGSYLWGYKIKQNGNIEKVPINKVKKLAKNNKIDGVKLVSKGGKTFLQGINQSINDLPQEWV